MPFFKDLRRRKTVLHPEKSIEASSSSDSNGTTPARTKSSSTLNSVDHNGTSTPASSVQPGQSTSNLAQTKSSATLSSLATRPVALSSASNRNSYVGGSTPASLHGTPPPKVPLSTFAPRILSISDNSWVHQKLLLIYGHIGDPNELALDGTLTVCHHQDSFPSAAWPVSESHFKALVHLSPGPNRLRFDFTSPKLVNSHSSLPTHCAWLTINFLPLINSPPLQLVIIKAKDSAGTFDAVPERLQRENNDEALAVKKFRMASYLWQAFTGEQMFRQGLGRRCFRFEEEWQMGTSSAKDGASGTMRNEAKVHIITSTKTVAELRDLNIAQQHVGASKKDALLAIALEDIQRHFSPSQKQALYVSALFLDSHWDLSAKTITGHAALSGHFNNIHIAMYGSHALHSYPACIEDVAPAFSDCTKTDNRYVVSDGTDAGSSWEAASQSIGAHLRETGHMLGCPSQEHGVMLQSYTPFNRTFMCREPYSTRTKSQGLRLCLPKDECNWHRLDTLRFKYHPCFRLPTDMPLNPDPSVQIWPVGNGQVIVTAPTGVAFAELYVDADEVCKSFIEYGSVDVQSAGPPKQIVLTEEEIRNRMNNKRARKVRVKVYSAGLGYASIDDLSLTVKSKTHTVKLPNGQAGFRAFSLGESKQQGTQPQEVLLETAHIQTKLLTSVRIYSGFALYGMEFMYEDSTSQMFGVRTGNSEEFTFDTRRGEIILGFYLRADVWVDGIEILTSLGRRSGIYGNANGGSGHTLVAPRGYHIAGISGTCGQWIDGFSLIITR